MQQERLIRKYANRRLYDTVGSRHVTLEDLRQLIVTGQRLKVVDDKSGEDLTRAVLLQIIAEQEQFGSPVLNVDLLEMIIRFYGRPMQAMLSRYLEQSFTALVKQQEVIQNEMTKALQAPFAPFADMARKNLELWQQMQNVGQAFTGGPAAGPAGVAGTAATAGTANTAGTAGTADKAAGRGDSSKDTQKGK